MITATKEEAVAATYVFWDIKRCPIPPGCEPRRVGQCIKQALKNAGYSSPPTINAVGVLSEISHDVLRALFSTGIVINHVAWDDTGFINFLLVWTFRNPPPANLMVISDQRVPFHLYRLHGYNIFNPFLFAYVEPRIYQLPSAEALWKIFLVQEGAFDEDKCSETGEPSRELWDCSICKGFGGQGFENFFKHLSTPKHASSLSLCLPVNKQQQHPDFEFTKQFWGFPNENEDEEDA